MHFLSLPKAICPALRLAAGLFTFAALAHGQSSAVGPQLTFTNQPTLQATVGAAHQLALNNVLTINTVYATTANHNRTGFFQDPPGTFIRAGADYPNPYTRDSAINSWNVGSLLSPVVAANTLWAVVARVNGNLIVQQDNQWWDQVIWIHAMWNHYLVTGDQTVLTPAYQAAVQTLAARQVNYNSQFGLYGGPSFFNDGISGYPPPLGDQGTGSSFVLDHAGTDKIMALSTNCVYVGALRATANLARELGRPASEAAGYDTQADALIVSINKYLWMPATSTYGYFVYGTGTNIGTVENYQEGCGYSFAILFGVADAAKARALVAGAHRDPKGLPSIWPNFSTFSDARPGRHNNIIWPLVNGLWAHAAASTGATATAANEIIGQAQLALASNEFYEVYNANTGAVDGGWQVGGPWTSATHQTWSASSYLRALYLGVFGLQFQRDGLRFAPNLPDGWSGVSLTQLPYRNGTLGITLTGSGSNVVGMTLDGTPISGDFLAASTLAGAHQIGLTLAPDSSALRVKTVGQKSGLVAVTVDAFTGHSYQLQRSDTLVGAFVNVGSPQTGATGTVLTFSDTNSNTQGFYRVQKDP